MGNGLELDKRQSTSGRCQLYYENIVYARCMLVGSLGICGLGTLQSDGGAVRLIARVFQ